MDIATTDEGESDDGDGLPAMNVLRIQESDHSKELLARQAFFEGKHHDHYASAWDGSHRPVNSTYLQERLRPAGFVPANAVGINARKPDSHGTIGRQVVTQFTDGILGRLPTLSVRGDEDAEAFLASIFEESGTWAALREGRTISGACGYSMIAIAVDEGQPVAETLSPWDCEVTWKRRGSEWIPIEVTEQRLVSRAVRDEEGRSVTKKYWRTRYWNTSCHVVYEDVPEDYDEDDDTKDTPIPIATEEDEDGNVTPCIYEHGIDECPIVVLQATRNTKSPCGDADCEGVWHLVDKVDRLQSGTTRATGANVDPTVVHADDERTRRKNAWLRKGHGAKIELSEKGSVKFLETTGASVEMGWKSVDRLEEECRRTTGAITVTPSNASTFKSGEAILALWRTFDMRVEDKRNPTQQAIRRLGKLWLALGRALGVSSEDDEEPEGIVLPPRAITPEPKKKPPVAPPPPAAPGQPAPPIPPPEKEEEPETVFRAHTPGKSRAVAVSWPPVQPLTPTQLGALVTALTTATGAKQVLSSETAVELLCEALGRGSPKEELDRIRGEKEEGSALAAAMFPASAPDDGDEDEKDDEEPAPGKPAKDEGVAAE